MGHVVDEQRLVALSVAAVRPGRVVLSASYGHADLNTGSPATADTGYLWFSMTKIVTATAVMQLVEQDRLALDAAVNQLVPAFAAVRQTRPVTVRHLLSHSAGLANPPPVRWVHPAGAAGPDPDVFLASQLRRHRRLRGVPGERARYSNLGYLVLGQVVAAVAKEPYTSYVTSHVLGPLGMTATGFERRHTPIEATVYQRAPRGAGALLRAVLPPGIVGARSGEWVSYHPFRLHGAAYGGLVGPLGDAARFLAAHLNGGAIDGSRILSASTAEQMRQITMRGRPYDLGLGWFQRPGAGSSRFVEHLGGGLGVYNTMRLYPDLGLGVVVMANSPGYDLEAVIAPVVAAANAGQL